MKRAVCAGAGMGALTAVWLYCLTCVYLTVDSALYLNPVIACAFAAVITLFYLWAGKEHYGRSLLFGLLFAILFIQLLPSPNDLYRRICRTEASLGGGGGFGLMLNILWSFPIFAAVFVILCAILRPIFNRNDITTILEKEGRKMNKVEQLYEGKAKKVFSTEDPEKVIVSYKDDATAFDGQKKGTIAGKGAINNQMTNFLMQQLEKAGVPTHFVEELSERETVVKKVDIVPLEVIIRNISAGSFAKRYGVDEGIVFDAPTVEFSYKNDDLHDPLINDHHAVALKLATWEEIDLIKKYAFQVNAFLKAELAECGVTLVDFKLEFGKTSDGTIVLADEISPDTCRFWDSKTGEKLDKDRFRRDLGNVEGAYQEMSRRLMGK